MTDTQQNNGVDTAVPSVIEHFLGQDHVVRQVRVALEAAWEDATPLPHILMTGGPGLGKTQLSHILSREMGGELYEQLAQNIQSIDQMRGTILEPHDRDILMLDEIHELSSQCQTCLYRAMENKQVFLDSSKSKRNRRLETSSFTLVACTTDPHKLLQPLRDRFKLVLHFDFYNDDDLALLVKQRVLRLQWSVADETIFPLIAQRGRGTPRIALRILESVRRVARSQGNKTLTIEHFNSACELEGIDSLGLGPIERKYLTVLAEHDEPVRLNVIASRIGLAPKTVSTTIEEFVLRVGLINKTDKGRTITKNGLDHLEAGSVEDAVCQ